MGKEIAKKPAAADSVLKRPSGEGILKKPAASLSARSIANSLLSDRGKADVEPTKDRLKTHQWNKNFLDLPEAIQQEYEKAGRAKKTAMVNNIVVRHSDGSYSFNTENKLYQETISKYEEKYADAGSKATIRSIMETQCGGKERLVCNLFSLYSKMMLMMFASRQFLLDDVCFQVIVQYLSEELPESS
jgi:hypothetical protein